MSVMPSGGAVAASSVAHSFLDVSIVRNDTTGCLFDVPLGKVSINAEGVASRVLKSASFRECEYQACERISIVDSPKLLSLQTPEERDELIRLSHLKTAFLEELQAYNASIPDEDDTSKLTSDMIGFYRIVNKSVAPFILFNTRKLLATPDDELRRDHAKQNVGDTFEDYKASLVRTVKQTERFLTSESLTLFEDITIRSLGAELSILYKYLATVGISDAQIHAEFEDEKRKGKIHLSEGQTAKEIELISKIFISKKHFFSLMKLEFSNVFSYVPESSENLALIAGLKSLISKTKAEEGVDLSFVSKAILSGIEEPTCEKVLNFIKENGPFAAGGFLGKARYFSAPIPFKPIPKIGESDVFCWPKGSARVEAKDFAHSVTVIGCVNEGPGLIFFKDPADISDPLNATSEKVYVISFKNFIENQSRVFFSRGLGVDLRA